MLNLVFWLIAGAIVGWLSGRPPLNGGFFLARLNTGRCRGSEC